MYEIGQQVTIINVPPSYNEQTKHNWVNLMDNTCGKTAKVIDIKGNYITLNNGYYYHTSFLTPVSRVPIVEPCHYGML